MKKILLISVMPGNMEFIYKNKSSNYNVELFKAYNYINKRLMGRFIKLKFLFKKYDLVIADYPTLLLKRGRKSIYMDHGSGLKLMPGLYEVNDKNIIKTSKAIEQATYFITQSKRERDILYTWLPYVKKENFDFRELGQPRNDKLFNKKFISDSNLYIRKKYGIPKKNKVVILAPTWRGYKCNFNNIFCEENIKILDEYFLKNNITLIYRPHYLENGIDIDLIQNMSSSKVISSLEEQDTQIVLTAADILISDYSGIIIEFLALNKPIIFLDVDSKEYDDYRGLAINYYNNLHTPGPKVKNIYEIIEYINSILKGIDIYKLIRNESIQYYYQNYDGNSVDRIWRFINEIL